MTLPLTPSQTVGPFFAIGLGATVGARVVPEGTPGAVRISGQVFDGDGKAVPDAIVELWQPEGVGRCATDDEGQFALWTVKPAALRHTGTAREAPHIDVSVFARGLLNRLVTRLYFADEDAANQADAVLGSLTPAERSTLVAASDDGGQRFDIHLQGPCETVFFER
jgi:protocatechuate 3,4-dioxygenase alpha subunit